MTYIDRRNWKAASSFALAIWLVASMLSWTSSLAAQQVSIIEHALSVRSGNCYGITAGPDGALWFTRGTLPPKVERITTAGAVTVYTVPAVSTAVTGITAGPDGALWFTETDGTGIGRISTAGVLTGYPVPTANSAPYGITAGPDGALWFTERRAGKIGRITTAGVVTEYPVLTFGSVPNEIAAGPDGALWFTEVAANRIGRITTAGVVTEYLVPTADSEPGGITSGPDGALWFAEYIGHAIGRITTSGVITEYPVSTPAGYPEGITAGPDGALWFTYENLGKIARITTAGVVTEYPGPFWAAFGITTGPDGTLWFVSNNVKQALFTEAVLSADPDSGVPGSSVMLTGGGFAPGEMVNLYGNSTSANLLGSKMADATGSFTTTGKARQSPSGPNNVVGIGQTSGKIGVAPFFINPRLIIDPSPARVGDTITVQGFGYGIGESVKVYWGTKPNGNFFLGTPVTNTLGSFSESDGNALMATIPAWAQPGPLPVTGISKSNQSVRATGYVLVE